MNHVAKLERLYILKDFYNHKLGYELLAFNIVLSKKNDQEGMWLYVWKENHRGVNFYKKFGFEIIGFYDFHLSPSHANPSYSMLLNYSLIKESGTIRPGPAYF